MKESGVMKVPKMTVIIILSLILVLQATKVVPVISLTPDDRLARLEPKEPSIMYDYQLLKYERDLSQFYKEVLPIKTILLKGHKLPFRIIFSDMDWKRPAYHPNWHSSSFRWCYIPINIAIQQHNLFIYQGGGSARYDLSNSLVLPNEIHKKSPFSEYAFTTKYPYVTRFIIFKAKPLSIKAYKNQLAVVVEPQRTGLHIIDFEHKQLQNQKLLVQMSTADGAELDYLLSGF